MPMNCEREANPALPEAACGLPPLGFRAMGYRARDAEPTASMVLIVLKDAEGCLSFLVHSEWRSMVLAKDLEYIASLFADFQERAKLDSEALFEQISSLGVGPLVTLQAGERISDHPDLLDGCSEFLKL